MNSGVWYGVAAYAAWGLFPLYWKLVAHVPATELLAHRIVWSFLTLLAVALASLRQTRARLRTTSRHTIRVYAAAAVLIALNWFLFIWAVNSGFVLETSLGYFITPLVNVLLGVLVFRERLRRWQWLAVALATLGVLSLTRAYGALPWVSLGLAVTFGTYGLIKKKAPLGSVDGLLLETSVLLLPALAYLAVLASSHGTFLRTGAVTDLLIMGGGVVTTIPLLMFSTAVQRVPLSVIGILQYIAPTMQFLLGVLLYREPFSRAQLTGFTFVWAALVVFGVDSVRTRRQASQPIVLDEGAL